jgi:hypothetical protein
MVDIGNTDGCTDAGGSVMGRRPRDHADPLRCSAESNLKPHRFLLDVTYFRARFFGADAQAGWPAFRGQKTDCVLLMALNLGLFSIVANAGAGFTECSHTVTSPFNDRCGIGSHLGIVTTLSNPGTLMVPVGLRAFPLKDHEFTGWYLYRAMVDTTPLEVAFAPELAARNMRGIRTAQYHEIGGYWL